MTVSEKTRLLPQEYQKSYVIPIPPTSEEDPNNNTPIVIREHDSYALSKAELSKFIDDPFWTRVRYICFSFYWLVCLVALILSCSIAVNALQSGFCDDIGGDNYSTTTTTSTMTDNAETTAIPTIVTAAAAVGADNSGVVLRMLSHPASSS